MLPHSHSHRLTDWSISDKEGKETVSIGRDNHSDEKGNDSC